MNELKSVKSDVEINYMHKSLSRSRCAYCSSLLFLKNHL